MNAQPMALDAEFVPPVQTMASARRPRVLVAEDDDDMRRLIAAILRQEGYDVVQVGSGIGLLQCVGGIQGDSWEIGFDAVVSDVQMPDLTAIEVLDAVSCRDIDTPIILVTGYGTASIRAEAYALGAVSVLDKPLHWPDLRREVRSAVSGV